MLSKNTESKPEMKDSIGGSRCCTLVMNEKMLRKQKKLN